MFNCDNCHKTSTKGEQPRMVVTKTRYKEYPVRHNTLTNGVRVVIDRGGSGTETVQEKKCCGLCAVKLTKSTSTEEV